MFKMCRTCWSFNEDVLCKECKKECSELSILEQIRFKENRLEQCEVDYTSLKIEMEGIDSVRAREDYDCTEEEISLWLKSKQWKVQQLKKEVKELKQHKDVRLHFLFEK